MSFAEEMANAGKVVVIAALDGDFQRKPFGSILDLIPLAEEVTKLNAVCMVCYGPASFSKRLGSETQVEVIGGADKYIAVCRGCYFAESTSPLASPSPSPVPQKTHHDAPIAVDVGSTSQPAEEDTAELAFISLAPHASPATMSVGMSAGRGI